MTSAKLAGLVSLSMAQALKYTVALKPKREIIYTDLLPHTLHEVNFVFNTNGVASFTLILGMTMATARRLVSRLVKTSVNDTNAILHATNVIASKICTRIIYNLNETGINTRSEGCTLLLGKEIIIPTPNTKKTAIEFETELGNITLRVGM